MAEPLIQRSLDWLSDWGDIVSDAGAALPFDLEVEPRREEVVGQYDVATIVRSYQLSWLHTEPNHITPIELRALLQTLGELTAQLEQAVGEHTEGSAMRAAKLGLMSGFLPGLGTMFWAVGDKAKRGEQRSLQAIALDLQRWRTRLDSYVSAVEAALPEREQDRAATLWTVTAPLLLGWYGGPTGSEIEIVGQPEGFDPQLRHPVDVGTPYRIANMLGVQLEWSRRRAELFKDDLQDGAEETGKVVGLAVAVGLAGIGAGVAATHFLKGRSSK